MRCYLLTSNQQHYFGAHGVDDAVEVPDARALDLIAQGIARSAEPTAPPEPPTPPVASATTGEEVGDKVETKELPVETATQPPAGETEANRKAGAKSR